MFGCGKFAEVEMLKYTEGKEKPVIEQHLRECRECLSEIMELNRVSALAGQFKPSFFSKPLFLSLEQKEGSFLSMKSALPASQLQILPETRSAGQDKKSFTGGLPGGTGKISVIPDGKGLFWIKIHASGKGLNRVLLKKPEENTPVYSVSDGGMETLIRELEPGEYDLTVGTSTIRITVKESAMHNSLRGVR